jgi:hypothetical protein
MQWQAAIPMAMQQHGGRAKPAAAGQTVGTAGARDGAMEMDSALAGAHPAPSADVAASESATAGISRCH